MEILLLLVLLAVLVVLIIIVRQLRRIRITLKYTLRFLGGRFADDRHGDNPYAHWED
jgi:hypothetical protein